MIDEFCMVLMMPLGFSFIGSKLLSVIVRSRLALIDIPLSCDLQAVCDLIVIGGFKIALICVHLLSYLQAVGGLKSSL